MISRHDFEFGQGSFVGQIAGNPEFFDLPERDQARILGWVAGCPVVEELTDPANTAPDRGPEAMIRRYGEISFWSGYIQSIVTIENPALAESMDMTVARRDHEKIGKHELESIPACYHDEMTRMTTVVGFALPRLFISVLNNRDGSEQPIERLRDAVEALRISSRDVSSPESLLVRFADKSIDFGLSTTDVLKSILPVGWLEEHNAVSMIERVKNVLPQYSEQLNQAYNMLSDDKKTELKVA